MVIDMTCREIEIDRVVILIYRMADGVINRATHRLVILAVAELTDYQSSQTSQDATHLEIIHHTVDMVMSLRYILNK